MSKKKNTPSVEEMDQAFNEVEEEPKADIIPVPEEIIVDLDLREEEPKAEAPATPTRDKTIMEQAADMALINAGKLKRA